MPIAIPELKETASRIRNAMQARGLNAKQLAKLIGISHPSSVYSWVNAVKVPSSRHRLALASALDLPEAELTPKDLPDRRRRQKKRTAENRAVLIGPAESAALAFRGDQPKQPGSTENFSAAIRSDGMMTIKLNISLPIPDGIVLVKVLFDAGILTNNTGI